MYYSQKVLISLSGVLLKAFISAKEIECDGERALAIEGVTQLHIEASASETRGASLVPIRELNLKRVRNSDFYIGIFARCDSLLSRRGSLPKSFVERFGDTPEKFFMGTVDLKAKYGDKLKEIPWEAVGLYSCLTQRIGVGLQQLMAGSRKWCLDLLSRSDLYALKERAAKVMGIPLAEDSDGEAISRILD